MKLQSLDLAIILIYLSGVTALGWILGRGQKSIRDYFIGDRDVPWWAIMLSIVATETSSVTFISIPGLAFTGNMTFLQIVIGYMIGRVVIVLLFIPQYFRGELYSVYQLLERRFGPPARRSASGLFLLTRTVADGLRLFLTALLVSELTGWSLVTAIMVSGIATIIYTYIGGMKAVIWTDVIQLIIYVAGAVAAGVILLQKIPGGWSEYVEVGSITGKFQVWDFAFDLSKTYTFWSGIFAGAFLTTSTHGTDQMLVQRYLCARSVNQAKAALLSSGILIFSQFILFLMIGVGLFVLYSDQNVSFSRADQVFPYFIASELPAGMIGLVVAAVFSAAMSTSSSSLNSSATASMTDFYRPLLKPDASDPHYLQVSRWLTAAFGAIQILVAIAGSTINESVINQVLGVASFANGPVLGVFLLGTLTERVNQNAALIAMGVGILIVASISFLLPGLAGIVIAWPWYVLIGATSTFITGLLLRNVGRRTSTLPDSAGSP